MRGKKTVRIRQRRQVEQSRIPSASMVGGSKINAPFQLLSEREMEQVHQTAIKLLATVGVANATDRVTKVAIERGCSISGSGRVLFPESLVEDQIALAAKDFVVHGRDAKFDFQANNSNLNFCTGGAAVSMLDIDSREYRSSTLRDLYDLARLCDCLENIQWFTRPVVARDMTDNYELDVNTIYACAAGTKKHIATSFVTGENVYRAEPLLNHLAGGEGKFFERPFCTVHITGIVSPLSFAPDALDVACAAVDIGMPINSLTGPQAGATAPAALAGTLAQGCAESLATLTVVNLLKSGHPVIFGNWLMVSDLRTGAFSGGGPEQALLGAASSQMSKFYGIPGGVGASMSDSKVPDAQAGFEKALTSTLAALGGGGFVYESAGMLGSLLGCSFESMVVDNELLSYVRRIAQGIEVNEQTLSLSVIDESVHGAGHFLGHPQTLELMKREYVYSEMIDRTSIDDWQDDGGKDLWQRATDRVKSILDSHHPNYIDSTADQVIRSEYPIHLEISNTAPPAL